MKKMKKILIPASVMTLLFVIFLGCLGTTGTTTSETTPSESEKESVVASDVSEESSESISEIETEEPSEVSEEHSESDALIISIDASQAGEYGKEMVFNEGTEFEEHTYFYAIPDGTYEVTNKTGFITQVNVYTDQKVVSDEGWEEWVIGEGGCTLFQVDETKEIVVPEGLGINVDGNTKIEMKKID